MLVIHKSALYVHILLGAIALFVFWLPVAARKGSQLHKKAGKIFNSCMYAVSVSGVLMCTIVWYDPIYIRYPGQSIAPETIERLIAQHRLNTEFLLLLSILVFASVLHSTNVLKAKADRSLLYTPGNIVINAILGVLSALVLAKGIYLSKPLLIIFGMISVTTSFNNFHYIFKKSIKPKEWIIEHMSSIIGAGIGTYTAFFAAGGRHWLSEILTGNLQLIPWILPGVIGVTSIAIFKKKYRKQFNIQGEQL
ncbi:hypothetical protein [Pleionea sediminis]|uniref:hypothetical protein n=1 Tax=Pleionea sediminis TaxID=2569479 RepID=UPI0011863BBF|nr:hypothetical protein [Pleionea sediminis]